MFCYLYIPTPPPTPHHAAKKTRWVEGSNTHLLILVATVYPAIPAIIAVLPARAAPLMPEKIATISSSAIAQIAVSGMMYFFNLILLYN